MPPAQTSHLLAVARGDAPADVVFRGGRLVNVHTGEIESVDVALAGDRIAGVGPGYDGLNEVFLDGRWIAPGLLDAHVHIESSLVTPPEFARAVVPRGTTTAVVDPHEIANVHGVEGIEYMLAASEGLPLQVLVQASSCVPATDMATAGARLEAGDLISLLDHPRVLGLAEVMNFPGVIFGDAGIRAKLDAFAGRPIDGHAPGVRGMHLNAYVAGGPASDHEATDPEEALEKLRRGLFLFIREATNARNLDALLPALTPGNLRRVAFCTDDRQPADLLDDGGIDFMVRRAIAAGIPPMEALRCATLNPAEFFGLVDRGAIAPGRRADLLILEDLHTLAIDQVWSGGEVVARGGVPLPWSGMPAPAPPAPSMAVHVASLDLELEVQGGPARIIQAIPDQIVTGRFEAVPAQANGTVASDPDRDILRLVVVERHSGSGAVGRGLVSGFGLRSGAMAGSVAHDHHNIIAVGVDTASLERAVRQVAEMGGGLTVTQGDRVLASLPLPVGGLMSLDPIEDVRRALDALLEAAGGLGSAMHDPFMALSFLGLEVIPTLKLTDRGLVDVDRFEIVDLWTGEADG